MKPARIAAAVLVLALALAAVARGELAQEGNLLISFDGGISPRALPRAATAPVAVLVDTTITATDGADPPPQLRQIAIAINKKGRIFDRGLPTCRIRSIQPSTIAAARRICGGAIIGSGHVAVRVMLGNQPPFTFQGRLLAFHAERSGGHRRILAQVYGLKPPSAFVLTFKVRRGKGTYGTVLTTTLPHGARKWAYVTHFDMRLQRSYMYGGKRHSYLNASCSAPPGFPGAVYPFARGTFTFDGGRQVSATLIRSCDVRSG